MTDKRMSFSFGYTTHEKIYMTMQNLDMKKTCQENNIPVNIIKSHKDIFPYFIHHNFYNSLFSSFFPSELKKADIIPIYRANLISKIFVLLVSFPFSPKFMKGVCLIKCIVTSIKFSLNISVDSDKVTAVSIPFFLW